MNLQKPILTLDEQIVHLKEKGVLFNIVDENYAREYLLNNNNYFKLTAYRKNYDKHTSGEKNGKYINLEFAYLVDISVIDMIMRYEIVHMALDIEHHVKLQILRKMYDYGENGYSIVQDYIDSLNETQKNIFENEIERNRENIYCGDIIQKYNNSYPVWAFLEIIPFGRLISFYKFCSDRYMDRAMKDNFYRLLTCKEIRNASAHSNCILNNLRSNLSSHNTNGEVTRELVKINGMNANFRRNRMSNARIQQIVTLLYTHRNMVISEGIQAHERQKISDIIRRIGKNYAYYNYNPIIKGSFDFLKLVLDSWFMNA